MKPTYFLHDGHICKSVLGEPTAMNDRQVQEQIAKHKQATAFFARSDPAVSAREREQGAELEALVTAK